MNNAPHNIYNDAELWPLFEEARESLIRLFNAYENKNGKKLVSVSFNGYTLSVLEYQLSDVVIAPTLMRAEDV